MVLGCITDLWEACPRLRISWRLAACWRFLRGAFLKSEARWLSPWFCLRSSFHGFLRTARRGRCSCFLFFGPLLNLSIAGLVLHVIQVPYRALNWAPVAWLGKISYSLYLWQELFCSNAALHQGYVLVLPALACACLSYYLVEQPMLRLREKRAKPRRREPGVLEAQGVALDTSKT
jgi:peptidoglycan/LPS O-acetylase OafA/YrhL